MTTPDDGGSFAQPTVLPDGTTEDEALDSVPPEELAFAERLLLDRIRRGVVALTPEERELYAELAEMESE